MLPSTLAGFQRAPVCLHLPWMLLLTGAGPLMTHHPLTTHSQVSTCRLAESTSLSSSALDAAVDWFQPTDDLRFENSGFANNLVSAASDCRVQVLQFKLLAKLAKLPLGNKDESSRVTVRTLGLEGQWMVTQWAVTLSNVGSNPTGKNRECPWRQYPGLRFVALDPPPPSPESVQHDSAMIANTGPLVLPAGTDLPVAD